MESTNKILRLKGKVQHYAWGGYDFIPSLLGLPNEEHKPFAEYWMGAHPGAPAEVIMNDGATSLNELIQQDPSTYLGEKVLNEFGELPYLFKVLDVHDMLSIQVHPTKEEAVKGFEAEEMAGIPITASDRNYKDKNHKPEVMVALSEFWLLHGFKKEDELQQVLLEVPEFNFLIADFEEGYYMMYKTVMELPQKKVDEILLPLVNRVMDEDAPSPHLPAYWVKKLFADNQSFENIDRGIFSIYFFNIVQLQKGEGVFQAAGIPHAYLYGQNVELMANSDNVLRGGLTPKHTDVPELLKHTRFEGIEPNILHGNQLADGELSYPCPVPDFGISAIQLKAGEVYKSTTTSAETFIITEGAVTTGEQNQSYKRGDSFLVLPGSDYNIQATENALLYKAFVPNQSAST